MKYSFPFDKEGWAKDTGITVDQLNSRLGDARFTSPYSEDVIEGKKLFIQDEWCTIIKISGEKHVDAFAVSTTGKMHKISIRGGKIFKAQLSCYIGSCRTCDTENLLHSISLFDYYLIHRIEGTSFVFYLVAADDLRQEVLAGNLTPSGWARDKLDSFLSKNSRAAA